MKKFSSALSVFFTSVTLSVAATRVVTTTNDSGAGSLRSAIAAAAGGDTVTFNLPMPSTITLTSGELLIDKKLTITGPGADLLAVARSSVAGTLNFSIVHTDSGNFAVVITGLTVSNGNNDQPTGGGGGLFNECAGAVTVSQCNITNNRAFDNGGGILHTGSGSLSLVDCLIANNFDVAASGGGLAAQVASGPVTVFHCSVSNNTDNYYGGGIYNGGGTIMTLTESTVSENALIGDRYHGVGDGGGISNDGTITITSCTIANNSNGRGFGGGVANQGTMTMINSTLYGNSTLADGGGILNDGANTFTACTITACTITQNVASQEDSGFPPPYYVGGGGISDFGIFSTAVLKNTIVAGNHSAINPDVAGILASGGYNLIGDATAGILTPDTGDQIGTAAAPIEPLLGPLADNGGPTQTCALLPGSPALDKGGPAIGITTDQRNFARPIDDMLVAPAPGGNNSDIGAFEAQVSRSQNISTRDQVLTGDNILDAGFIITGTTAKDVLIRGIGPSLTSQGVSGVLANPTLELHGPNSGALLASNDDWQDTQKAAIEATGAAPTNPLESAILATLEPGTYTTILSGKNGGIGIGLVEVYDLDGPSDATLANVSTRGFVGEGDNVLIGGFILGPGGSASSMILARAIGPSLATANVTDPLQDPQLELYNSSGVSIAFDDNWKDSQETAIEATGLAPKNDKEPAILATLPAGVYTAIVRGVAATTGVALVEVYNLQ